MLNLIYLYMDVNENEHLAIIENGTKYGLVTDISAADDGLNVLKEAVDWLESDGCKSNVELAEIVKSCAARDLTGVHDWGINDLCALLLKNEIISMRVAMVMD